TRRRAVTVMPSMSVALLAVGAVAGAASCACRPGAARAMTIARLRVVARMLAGFMWSPGVLVARGRLPRGDKTRDGAHAAASYLRTMGPDAGRREHCHPWSRAPHDRKVSRCRS